MVNDELKRRIIKLFYDNKDLVNKLINEDVESIQSLGFISNFSAKDIVYAYKNNKIEIFELYNDLCLTLAKKRSRHIKK